MKSRTSTSSANNKTGLVLTLEQFITSIPSHTVNPKDIKNTLEKHSLAKKQIISLPPTGLAYFANLRQLDLSDNLIQDLSPLSHMPSLRHLNLSKNKVSDLAPLATLHKTLMVLDVSAQKDKTLSSLNSMFTTSSNNNSKSKNKSTTIIFSNLKTIIATDNDLLTLGFYGPAENLQLINRKQDFEKEVEDENQKKGGAKSAEGKSVFDKNNDNNKIQSPLPVLETLILSRNPTLGNQQPPQAYHQSANETEIDLWGSLHLVSSSLRKLSLSDCGLQHPLPQHLSLPLVTELRLAKNHFCAFPKTIRFKSLQILDVSHNQFESLDSVARFPFLKHLSVAGNPAMMNTNKHGDTLASSDSNKTLSKKMNEFLAFLYLFFKDLHTVDGKKFDREVVKASLDKNLVRQIKLRVIRGEQEDEEEEKEETQKQEKKNKIEKDNNEDDEELDFDDDEGFLPEDFLDDDDEEDEEDDFNNQNGDDDDQLLGHNDDDDDDDGANDPTILMRRRRRREDSDDDDEGGMDKKRSNNKKMTVVKGQINSDDEEAIDADDFLKGTSNTTKPSNLSEMAVKSIQSIKRRAPTTTTSSNTNNNSNSSKGGNKNKNNAAPTSTTTTDSATVIAALQRAAANSKTIAQW